MILTGPAAKEVYFPTSKFTFMDEQVGMVDNTVYIYLQKVYNFEMFENVLFYIFRISRTCCPV